MDISISTMKMVIDELQVAEVEYKKQLSVFEKIYLKYQSIDQEGKDKHTLRKISEDLNNEYLSIKKFKETLIEIVRLYGHTESNIIKRSSDAFGNRPVFKKIDIEAARVILDKYNIKIM